MRPTESIILDGVTYIRADCAERYVETCTPSPGDEYLPKTTVANISSWIGWQPIHNCPICGAGWGKAPRGDKYNYCSNCGAKVDKYGTKKQDERCKELISEAMALEIELRDGETMESVAGRVCQAIKAR